MATYSSALYEKTLMRRQSCAGKTAKLTLVVDGVAQAKEAADDPRKGSGRRVLAVEETGLDAARGLCGRGALGQLGVKVDEGRKAGSRARGLSQKSVTKMRELQAAGILARMEGVAILGGTRPPSWRRMREGCMVVGERDECTDESWRCAVPPGDLTRKDPP